jgi:hypothetical protein
MRHVSRNRYNRAIPLSCQALNTAVSLVPECFPEGRRYKETGSGFDLVDMSNWL